MKKHKSDIYISDKTKLTEKAFKQSITISIIGILLCMVALCSVTWAWFSTEISSSPSDIRSAYCDVTVSVANENNILDPVDGKYNFVKNKAYRILITATGNAETAYCILNVDGTNYYTAQIPIGESIAFTVQFNNAETTEVEIIKCWGTSSVPDEDRIFKNGGLYLNLEKVDKLPEVIFVTNSTTETAEEQPTSNEPIVEKTTTSETTAETEPTATFPEVTE